MLPPGLTEEALTAAEREGDPDSLAAAARLRAWFGPELAVRAAEQAVLRRRARVKFGPAAADLFFTRDGLEQATRPAVADLHAARLAEAGATRVLDLGCGIGADALALLRAGLEVVAVERDPRTAEIAAANLRNLARRLAVREPRVITGDAEQLAEGLLAVAPASGSSARSSARTSSRSSSGEAAGASGVDAIFLDPARRSGSGRLWRVEDFSPSWTLVSRLLGGPRPVLVKLGPALPHRLIPDGVEAEWVSDHGDCVEVVLGAGGSAEAGRRSALITPDRRIVATGARAEVRPLDAYVYEPDGAVIRCGAVGELARRLGAGLIGSDIAYLSASTITATPFATGFAVRDVLPYKEKTLRGWVRERRIGSLEIKVRGVDVDPAVLRRRLRVAGPERATMIISRTPAGARVIVAERLPVSG